MTRAEKIIVWTIFTLDALGFIALAVYQLTGCCR